MSSIENRLKTVFIDSLFLDASLDVSALEYNKIKE